MYYQLLNILRRFVTGKAAKWLILLIILLPVAFILSRFIGLSRNVTLLVVFGVLAIIVVVWVIGALGSKFGKGKRSKDFEADLGQHARQGPASREEIQEAVQDLSQQWQHSMQELKEHGISVYELPWFLLIGEPQSGKSTSLEKSGLEFPIGTDALSGAGGTRNCDWWFTEEAVILDTAGRFTFQEDTAPDRHEWEAFLTLLRKHRRECPVNGVVVVIPATSLTEDTVEEQELKAKNIQKKLRHLQKALDIRFPIFILITKCDRILGFSEFFSHLDPEYHGQIFGWSNPEESERWNPDALPEILGAIVQKVHKLRLRLLKQLVDAEQVDRMLVFPEELQELREPLHNYLHTIFKTSRFEEPLIFRGFYLTSGLQEGRPIARACRDLLRVQMGDPQGVLEDLETVFRRSYAFFIRDFYEKKVFPEQGLVKRTQAALKKEKRYKRIFYGLIGAAAAVLLFLLVPAMLHLSRVLRPINELTQEAKVCIEAMESEVQEPCSVDLTYELVYRIDQARQGLRESRWVMRLLLRSGVKNEIGQELLPTVQAGLLRDGVLAPLLDSFEARSPGAWRDGADYPLFRDAFETRLRFDQYQRAAAPAAKEELEEATHLAPLLRFLARHPGTDDSVEGEEIDDWLADTSHLGDVEEAERIFRSVLTADERFDVMAVGKLPKPERALATFEAFWTIEVLARWDFELQDRFFRVYQESYDAILDLDPEAEGSEAALASFAELGARLGQTYDDGAVYMKDRRPAAVAVDEPEEPEEQEEEESSRRRRRRGRAVVEEAVEEAAAPGDRPGAGHEAWQKNCAADYEALRRIHDRLAPAKRIAEHCSRIPGDWDQLLLSRRDFDHLFAESTDGALDWSPAAGEVKQSLADLAALASPERVAADRSELQRRLDGASGDTDRLEELRRFYEGERQALWAPVVRLEEFERSRPDERFRAVLGRERTTTVAALAAGSKILPPADGYLSDKFRLDCEACFSADYAKNLVRPTNEFLGWANRALAPVRSVAEIRQPLDAINDAVYRYLEEFIRRLRPASGGGGGGGLTLPYAAEAAASWPSFTAAVRRWRPAAPAAAPRASSGGGLTQAMVEEFARSNDRLQPLVAEFRRRTTARVAPAAEIPPELERAISDYRLTLEVLDDDPLEAWKQLALGRDGAVLADFHAFSRNRRLARDRSARWLVDNVELRGARLLSDAIRPGFERRAAEFWRAQEICCRDRFPFITEEELRRQRRGYERGYTAPQGRGDLWLNRVSDQTKRLVTLPVLLETVSEDEIDRLFFAGGSLDGLFREFALDVIVEPGEDGEPLTSVDFVGRDKEKLRILRRWQRFLYGDPEAAAEARRTLGDQQEFSVRIVERESTGERTYLGERAGQINLFGPYAIRPSTDARLGRVRTVPLKLDDSPLSVTAINEDRTAGWTGRLELRGGPLKLLYFVLMASDGNPRADGREWTVRIEVPDFEYPTRRLEGIFELAFERPVPGVFPDLEP